MNAILNKTDTLRRHAKTKVPHAILQQIQQDMLADPRRVTLRSDANDEEQDKQYKHNKQN